MKLRLGSIALAFVSLVLSMTAQTTSSKTVGTTAATQSPATSAAVVTSQVPRLVKLSGTVQDFASDTTGSGVVAREAATPASVVGITFSLYSEQTGGVPLWSEVQNVPIDKTGHYTVELGSTKPDGLPVELFSSVQAQWLGVQQEGQAEQPRIMLLSVPYALKAADAETFGGKPPSAFMPAPDPETAANTTGIPANAKNNNQPSVSGGGTANYIALWTSASNLGSSAIYQSSNNNIGIGSTSPQYPLVVHAHSSGPVVEVTQSGMAGTSILGNSYATTGNNIGVQGQSSSDSGIGVEGLATAASGNAIAVAGTASSSEGVGIFGTATSTTGNTYGVDGRAASPTGVGVAGRALSTTGVAIGVSGETDSTSGVGVIGLASANTGVTFGMKGTTNSSGGVGVYGVALSNSGHNYAVEGTNASSDGAGAYGQNTSTTGNALGVKGATDSTAGTAIFGVAIATAATHVGDRPIGVWGSTNEDGGVGVLGTTDNGIAVEGSNTASNVATADFTNEESTRIDAAVLVTRGSNYGGLCLIDVSGNLDCTGSKSAVVPVDGGTRKVALYAVEAPENWFEDAGSGRLSNGAAVVQLEPTFAQTVNSEVEYHVFLTPDEDCKGLYVTNRTADSFEVRELGGGAANVAFDYRIMARRKGYEDIRLADNTERFTAIASEHRSPSVARKALVVPSVPELAVPMAREGGSRPSK